MRSGKALKVLLSGGFSLLMKLDSKIRNSVFFFFFGRTYYLKMVRVDILTAIANYGVVSNTRLGWAGEGLTGAIAQTSMLNSANV